MNTKVKILIGLVGVSALLSAGCVNFGFSNTSQTYKDDKKIKNRTVVDSNRGYTYVHHQRTVDARHRPVYFVGCSCKGEKPVKPAIYPAGSIIKVVHTCQ